MWRYNWRSESLVMKSKGLRRGKVEMVSHGLHEGAPYSIGVQQDSRVARWVCIVGVGSTSSSRVSVSMAVVQGKSNMRAIRNSRQQCATASKSVPVPLTMFWAASKQSNRAVTGGGE